MRQNFVLDDGRVVLDVAVSIAMVATYITGHVGQHLCENSLSDGSLIYSALMCMSHTKRVDQELWSKDLFHEGYV